MDHGPQNSENGLYKYFFNFEKGGWPPNPHTHGSIDFQRKTGLFPHTYNTEYLFILNRQMVEKVARTFFRIERYTD